MTNTSKDLLQKIIDKADVKLDGGRPWDIKVKNERFYKRVLADGILGIGESYMDGDWDCDQLDELSFRIFKSDAMKSLESLSWKDKLHGLQAKLTNMQTKIRTYEVGSKHYDVGNDLYKYMLGPTMAYTCGYWRGGAKNLDEAQEAKFDLICRKVGLKAGDTILDIGSGFASFLTYAAKNYGAIGTGMSVSKEQVEMANERSKGLQVETLFQDYRDPILDSEGRMKKFNHIISIGMFEHVGPKNYVEFMQIADRHLKPGGLFLLHTIGQPESRMSNDPWTHKYIFPNSQAPSIAQVAKSAEGIFNIEDLHTFGTDYEPTTLAWHKNFTDNWNTIKELKNPDGSLKYDERFKRMWDFYLLVVSGLSRSQKSSLWQFVLSRGEVPGGYKAIRY